MMAPVSSPLQRAHVVVSIDDEPAVLSALRRLFRNEPFEFLATEKPDEALAWILERHASMVVTDQRMPSISGLALLERVRACSPSTLRVMLTGHSDLTGVFKRARIEAVQKLIRKPWDGDELRRTVRELLVEVERRAEQDNGP
jgi:DNA-binding NtrC family response regulator